MGLLEDELDNLDKPITAAEKLKAIKDLRIEVMASNDTTVIFIKHLKKSIRFLNIQLWLLIAIFLFMIGLSFYFKYLRSKPATVIDKEFILKEKKAIKETQLLLYQQMDAHSKEVAAFRARSRYQDSLNANKDSLNIIKEKDLFKRDSANDAQTKLINQQFITMKAELLQIESFKKNPPRKELLKKPK